MLKTCIDYLKMHSECTILMQISHNFPGEIPDPHLRGSPDPSPTFPLSALRASVKHSAILVTCAPPPPIPPTPAVEVLDPPLFYEYNCRCILDYGMFIFYNGSSLEKHQFFSSKQTHMTTKQDNYSQRA